MTDLATTRPPGPGRGRAPAVSPSSTTRGELRRASMGPLPVACSSGRSFVAS